MADCFKTKLQRNMIRDCNEELTPGVSRFFLMGQLSQISSIAYNADNSLIIDAITLYTGEKLKKYEGFGESTAPGMGHSRNNFGTRFPQTFNFAVLSNQASAKAEMEALAHADDLFVMFKRAGNGPWEEMGIQNGMQLVTENGVVYNPNDPDNAGAYVFQLTNPYARRPMHTILHKTSSLEDTTSWLDTLTLAVA